jgi:hypothetical protein
VNIGELAAKAGMNMRSRLLAVIDRIETVSSVGRLGAALPKGASGERFLASGIASD